MVEGERSPELAEVGGVTLEPVAAARSVEATDEPTLERLSRVRVGAGSLFAAPAIDETNQWLIVGILAVSILLVYTLICGPILISY